MIFFLKGPVKIREIVKTYGKRNLKNGRISLFKQFYRFLQS